MGHGDGRCGLPDRGRRRLAQVGLTCLGYGCFLATYSGVPLGPGFYLGWQQALLLQFVFFAGIALGCVGLGGYSRGRGPAPSPLAGAALYAVVAVLCLVSERALARPSLGLPAGCALSAMFGLVSAVPLLFWYDRLLGVSRVSGRARCVALLVLSELVSSLVFLFLGLVSRESFDAGFAAMVASVAVSAICQAVLSRMGGEGADVADASAVRGEPYRLTSHSASLLACLGVSWGLVCCAVSFIEKSGTPGTHPVVSFATAVAVFVAMGVLVKMFRCWRFGAFARLSVAASGIVVAALPILHALSPQAFYPFGQSLFILIEVSVAFFSIEICIERRLGTLAVASANCALFLLSSCAAALAFWLCQVLAGGQTALELTALLGALSVAAVIMFLPSRESDATAFTLDVLPENTSLEDRMVQRRAGMAVKFGLTDAEAEVLDRMFGGMTRQQIAEDLHLSPWTIKDRVGSIYRKAGVHSYKELVYLLENDA